MKYVARPLSDMGKKLAPRGVHKFKISDHEEEGSNLNGPYLKIKHKSIIDGIEYTITGFLDHSEFGFKKLHAYCAAVGRDYRLNDLSNLKNDTGWYLLDIVEKEGIDKESGKKFTYRTNVIKWYYTDFEAQEKIAMDERKPQEAPVVNKQKMVEDFNREMDEDEIPF